MSVINSEEIERINAAMRQYSDSLKAAGNQWERVVCTELTVEHPHGEQSRIYLAVPMNADPEKLDAWTRLKYDRQVAWRARAEKERKRRAWWQQFRSNPVKALWMLVRNRAAGRR